MDSISKDKNELKVITTGIFVILYLCTVITAAGIALSFTNIISASILCWIVSTTFKHLQNLWIYQLSKCVYYAALLFSMAFVPFTVSLNVG